MDPSGWVYTTILTPQRFQKFHFCTVEELVTMPFFRGYSKLDDSNSYVSQLMSNCIDKLQRSQRSAHTKILHMGDTESLDVCGY